MFLNFSLLSVALSFTSLNRKHEMFLNRMRKAKKTEKRELNRKHEMFLNQNNSR